MINTAIIKMNSRPFTASTKYLRYYPFNTLTIQQTQILYPMKNLLLLFFLLAALVSCQNEKKTAPQPDDRLQSKHEPYEQFFLQRSYPDKTVDIPAYEAALQEVKSGALQKSGIGFDAEWTVQGPGNIGARINTIAVHPTDPEIIYVGFARGGVWKTIDGGLNWEPIFDDQLFLAIGDIEIDKNDPNTVYVGTGDPNISGLPFIGNGVYKSTDAGASWTNIGLGETRITSRILSHPADPEKLFVGTMGVPFETTDDRGLYRTSDGGQTWEQSLFVADSAGVIDIVMHPENPDILYASSWNRIRNNQKSRVHGLDAKIWKTTDGGDTWNVLGNGLPTGDQGRIGLTISQTDPEKLYALYVAANSRLLGIWMTNDGGESWNELAMEEELREDALASFGWYFGKIRVDPEDENHIFFHGVELWEAYVFSPQDVIYNQASPDWFTYEVHADKHDLVWTGEGHILLATDGGLYKSTDGAATWTDIENIPTSQFYRVAYNPHQPQNYYGGMQDNGSSGGNAAIINNWPRIYGGDGFQMQFHPENPDVFFAETQNGNIVSTDNGGQFFFGADDGIDNGDRRNWDMQYIFSHHDPNVMYTGTMRAYQGDFFNGSGFWTPISDDLTDGPIFGGGSFHSITTLDESHFTQGELYYGTNDGNVWRIDQIGAAATEITGNLPNRYVTDIKTSPSVDNRVYVTHSGYKYNEFIPRVHRSDDNGDNWTDISGDLPNLAINDIYILPENQDTVLFAATDGGVYGSLNAGENWERLGNNMPYVPVYDLELNVAQNELIAGTFARSIMTYPIDSLLAMPVDTTTNNPPDTTVAVRDILYDFNKLHIYPSPARANINVEFEKTEPGKTFELVILSAAGKLMHRESGKTEGLISRNIDVSDLPAGNYFVKVKFRHTLRSGSFVKL